MVKPFGVLVQIYEIQTQQEATAMVELGVDHVGTVLTDEAAWRSEEIKATVKIVQQAGAKSSIIPLFNEPNLIMQVLGYYVPDLIHFCESIATEDGESEECQRLINLQKQIRSEYPKVKIIRTIPIAQTQHAERVPSLEVAKKFEPYSDYLMTDTYLVDAVDQPVANAVGITGKLCDWDVSRKLVEQSSIPVILAGGLSPENVREAIKYVGPAGVDSCTQTNACDEVGKPIRFKKDIDRVRAFVESVREGNKLIF